MYFEDMTPAAQEELATRAIADEAGARIGFKVWSDQGKYRYTLPRERAAASLLRHWRDSDEVEFWSFDPEDDYVPTLADRIAAL